ncbi:hypothetical protein HA402_011050 [Bradysia odoriphaga]|nr:hypothetical protein HA402_011050 [Bradysia odoriphaga]
MDIGYLSGCNRLNNFLTFINHTSDVDMRLFAYNALFNKISYDPMLSKQTTNWLSLQHFVSHDVSIDSNSQYQNLLTEIESKTNNVLDSPSFDQFDGDYCTYYSFSEQTIYAEYLIKRFSSTDPANIKVLWKIIRSKSLSTDANTILQFVKELERNNRLNYTIMALPHIRSKWCSIYYKHDFCQQLLDVFPEGSTLRDFLTESNKFYIKNVYSGEYLCYGSQSYSYLYEYSSTRPTNIFTCGTMNSTWTFPGKDGFLIASGESSSRNVALDKCEHHNDWYIALKEKYSSYIYGYYENEEFYWELETDNVVNNQFRLKSPKTGGYLRVGQNDELLISIPECNHSDERKSEWIVERSVYYYLNDDYEVASKSSVLTDSDEEY